MTTERQCQIVSMLVEGNSIRSIERMTGCHRDTILRHLVRVGRHCQELHDDLVRASYPGAIQDHFNGHSSYGQVVKAYRGGATDAQHRYSPPGMSMTRRIGLWGMPRWRYISTSHIERQNLTMRMSMRRFTRLTNAFSKKPENLRAAVALHFMHYNFCRAHISLGATTPAVMAGLAAGKWGIERLLPSWG